MHTIINKILDEFNNVFPILEFTLEWEQNNYLGFLNIRINKYNINLLKPTGYGMHQQVTHFNNCTFCPYCIYV
jgi:hypothetical protein